MNLLPYKNIFPEIGEDVFIAPGVWIIGDVVIGKGSSIWFNSVVRGDEHYIRIGMETNVQDACILHGTPEQFPLEIGNRVTIGHRAIVHGCIVEDECMIGMGAIVMDGSRIGAGSLVAAGALVTQGSVIPPGSIVMGSPGRVVKAATEADRQRMQRSMTNYLQLTKEYRETGICDQMKRIKGFLG